MIEGQVPRRQGEAFKVSSAALAQLAYHCNARVVTISMHAVFKDCEQLTRLFFHLNSTLDMVRTS